MWMRAYGVKGPVRGDPGDRAQGARGQHFEEARPASSLISITRTVSARGYVSSEKSNGSLLVMPHLRTLSLIDTTASQQLSLGAGLERPSSGSEASIRRVNWDRGRGICHGQSPEYLPFCRRVGKGHARYQQQHLQSYAQPGHHRQWQEGQRGGWRPFSCQECCACRCAGD